MSTDSVDEVIGQLGYQPEIATLRQTISDWLCKADSEMQEALNWQFGGNSKYFRPMTVFSCHRSCVPGQIPEHILRSALVIEMFHNVSLIIDDIVDKSSHRRGKHTLHYEFGDLSALMISGYIVADAYRLVADDKHNIRLFSELMSRLGVAEVMQWRLRRQPLGVEDWRKIAGEDTGSMFEVCACLGTRNDALRKFGGLLGLVYHGCDDVADVMGLEALGGGGEEDIRDGILTLPAALAIRDPEIRDLFCKPNPCDADLSLLREAFMEKLPEAEQYLDGIANEARVEARLFARNPEPLYAIVDHTRELSQR
jgi:geranylgeranyl pyrophosphate synthase|tara:strand:- start:1714 stop:2646 length:933 start_codon:yes stop_codon:yes gene_type:complete